MAVAVPTSRKARAGARAVRMCAATRRAMPADELIRFACTADGTVKPDIARRLGGRGVWLTASERVVRDAARRGVFARGFKREAKTAATLAEDTAQALAEAALRALKAAQRAGLVVTGRAAVTEALARDAAQGRVIALIGPPAALRDEFASNRADLPVFTVFTPAQLGLALGGPVVVHAAVLAGPAGNKFLNRCEGLVRFRTPEGEASHVAGTPTGGTAAGGTAKIQDDRN